MAKEKTERPLSALERVLQTALGKGQSVGADDDPAATKFPTLWEWLSRIYVGNDHLRQPATISLSLGPTGVLVSIRDQDLGVSCGATCQHLEGIFQALEDSLSADVPPIRTFKNKEPKLRRRAHN